MVDLSDREISAEIIEGCRLGDRNAFRALYDAYKDRVYSIALRYSCSQPVTAYKYMNPRAALGVGLRYALSRGGSLGPDRRDPYVRRLSARCRGGREEYLVDRLLVASLVEARGCERLALVGGAHPDEETRTFYRELARSEARHQDLYADLARLYGDPSDVARREAELAADEARILAELPPVPALFAAGADAA